MRFIISLCVMVFIITPGIVSANKTRVALVIGNGDYKDSPLSNPVNDANAISDALIDCNFNVIKHINANKKEVRGAIIGFGEMLGKEATGLFYYAGHGIQLRKNNYLIPIGAEIYQEDEIEDECINLSFVSKTMRDSKSNLNIIILDACRNNPLGRSFSRSGDFGLAEIRAPRSTFISYATSPGSIALDNSKDMKHGLFTSALLKYMMSPNIQIEKVFRKIRKEVVNNSNGLQTPWESSSLIEDFFFNPSSSSKKKSTQNHIILIPPKADILKINHSRYTPLPSF